MALIVVPIGNMILVDVREWIPAQAHVVEGTTSAITDRGRREDRTEDRDTFGMTADTIPGM